MRQRISSLRFKLLALTSLIPLCFAVPARCQSVTTFASGISSARGLAVDASGQLYCSQRNVGAIVRCAPPSNTMTTFASGIADPIDMVFDDSGNMYVLDFNSGGTPGHIYKITPGGTKTIFKTLTGYSCLTRDAAGNLYAGQNFQQKVLKVTPAGDTSTYIPAVGDANARLSMVHMDADGTLYAGTEHGVIYKIGAGGSPITTLCSGLTNVFGFDRGPDGNWYVSTYAGDRIWRITPAGVASAFSGAEGVTALTNGAVGIARFNHPTGLLTVGGGIFVADTQNNVIRLIDGVVPAVRSSWGRVKALYR